MPLRDAGAKAVGLKKLFQRVDDFEIEDNDWIREIEEGEDFHACSLTCDQFSATLTRELQALESRLWREHKEINEALGYKRQEEQLRAEIEQLQQATSDVLSTVREMRSRVQEVEMDTRRVLEAATQAELEMEKTAKWCRSTVTLYKTVCFVRWMHVTDELTAGIAMDPEFNRVRFFELPVREGTREERVAHADQIWTMLEQCLTGEGEESE